MKSLQLLVIFGLACTVYAKCLQPIPMKNFDLKRFTGIWYHGTVDALNPKETPTFANSICGKKSILLDSGRTALGKWNVDLILGKGKKSDLRGPFYVPNLNRGLFKLFYQNGNFTYDFTVLCTDYTNWAATYSCADVKPNYTSDYVLFFLRDMSTFNEMISKPEIQECFRRVTNIPMHQLHKIPHKNCPPQYYQ